MNAARLLETAQAHPLRSGVLLLLFAVVYKSWQAIYRLYLHPLSNFPGPREAALSTTWLFNLSQTGQQEQEFERLHQKYRTHALRIAPNELHLSDVSAYKTIYSQSRPFPKPGSFYGNFGTPHTLFTETDFALHKERRRLLNPFFARSGILKVEPALKKHMEALRLKLCRLTEQGQPIVAHNAFRCVTVDIITEFAFAKSRLLVDGSDDRFEADFPKTFDLASDRLWNTVFHPLARQIGEYVPRKLITTFSPSLRLVFALVDEGHSSLKAYKSSIPKTNGSPVIFDSLHHLPDEAVGLEAVDFLVAGSDTTAFTLASAVWHMCHNSSIKHKLAAALKEAFPDQPEGYYPSLMQLEAIPYLVACVKESLRIAMPVPGRLPRLVPATATPLVIDEKILPPGSVVGMSAYTMHFSEEIWGSNARHFEPERWLGEGAKGLDEHMVTFSKGARSCIGQPLAQAELLLMYFMLFRNFDVELDPASEGGFTAKDNFVHSVQKPGVVLRMRRI